MHRDGRNLLEFKSDEEGVALLELSVVLPVVMLIGFGAIEFGNLIYQDHLLWNGVRDGARYYARLPYDSGNAAQISANEAKAKNVTVTGIDGSGGTARVTGWTTSDVTITYATVTNSSNSYRGPNPITMVTVRTDFSYPSIGFMGFLGLGPISLTAKHEERIIGW